MDQKLQKIRLPNVKIMKEIERKKKVVAGTQREYSIDEVKGN